MTQEPEKNDPDVEEPLRRALRVDPPSPERMARIRAAVAERWRERVAAGPVATRRWRSAPRWMPVAAGIAAAGLVTVVVALAWLALMQPGAVIGRVERVTGGVITVRSAPLRSHDWTRGDVVRAGDRINARGGALIALTTGGNVRIRPHSRLRFSSTSEIDLRDGAVYLDLPPGEPRAAPPWRVRTRAGVIEHLGTEFEVSCHRADIVIRVREGHVRWNAGAKSLIVAAGSEVRIGPAGRVLDGVATVKTDAWSWVDRLAPSYEIDGRPMLGFLQWFSRQTGRALVFVDARAFEIATRTILHGSVGDEAPDRAFANVLATTSLRYHIDARTVQLYSAP
ncbi:MAG: FecR domain-containing protein [Gammaproteobacteria bacterium]|nr:FecR domain-containing protein [Gammaproteobacteria bacterium]